MDARSNCAEREAKLGNNCNCGNRIIKQINHEFGDFGITRRQTNKGQVAELKMPLQSYDEPYRTECAKGGDRTNRYWKSIYVEVTRVMDNRRKQDCFAEMKNKRRQNK